MIGLQTQQPNLASDQSFGRPLPVRWCLLCLVVAIFASSGCRQRAITELYIEDMARRNRALEDLVYDFDAENQAMEFELEDLRRTNAQLQGRLQELQRQRSIESRNGSSAGSVISPSDKPRSGESLRLKNGGQKNSEEVIRSPKGENASNGATAEGANRTPAPLRLPSNRNGLPSELRTDEVPLEAPEIIVPPPKQEAPVQSLPKEGSLEGLSKQPETLMPPEKIAPESAKGTGSEPILPGPPPLPSIPKAIAPESILPNPVLPDGLGVPDALPPANNNGDTPKGKSSLLKPAPNGLPTDNVQSGDPARRIFTPRAERGRGQSANGSVALASGTEPVIKPIGPKDRRVREIDWHPVLCRARNTDGKPGDDGLYLVLIPRNTHGEFVPEVGNLTLVVEETLADGSVSRVGRWEYTIDEVRDLFEQIGSAPGIHVAVDWQEHTPTGSQVDVYAKLTMEDGTTMVNRRTISLKRFANGSSTWTPR